MLNIARDVDYDVHHQIIEHYSEGKGHDLLQGTLVVVESDQDMALGISDAPTCWLMVHSIAVFSAEKNPTIGEAFQEFIEQELKVPKHR